VAEKHNNQTEKFTRDFQQLHQAKDKLEDMSPGII
jgi:hypothetical protein